MTPQEFNHFRDNLNPASGFQSIQFREIEFLCGVRRTETLAHIEMDDAQRARLHALLERRRSTITSKRCSRGAASPRPAPRWSRACGKIYTNAKRTTICICCSKI